jgi:hypothetical protein
VDCHPLTDPAIVDANALALCPESGKIVPLAVAVQTAASHWFGA